MTVFAAQSLHKKYFKGFVCNVAAVAPKVRVIQYTTVSTSLYVHDMYASNVLYGYCKYIDESL